MEILYAIISVARQVEGEYIVVKPEKVYRSKQKAEEVVNQLTKHYAETIQTPTGPIQCVCTRGIFEIEVEN